MLAKIKTRWSSKYIIFIRIGNGLLGILKIECTQESLKELMKYEAFWPHLQRVRFCGSGETFRNLHFGHSDTGGSRGTLWNMELGKIKEIEKGSMGREMAWRRNTLADPSGGKMVVHETGDKIPKSGSAGRALPVPPASPLVFIETTDIP